MMGHFATGDGMGITPVVANGDPAYTRRYCILTYSASVLLPVGVGTCTYSGYIHIFALHLDVVWMIRMVDGMVYWSWDRH